MITLAKFAAEAILPLIGFGKPPVPMFGMAIKASSTRLECLKRNQSCVSCGCRGTIFLLQHHIPGVTHQTNCFIENCSWCSLIPIRKKSRDMPHLNLYHIGKKGGLMLMTQDHIMPKSLGGSNRIENLQTMCRCCNTFKGSTIPAHLQVT